MDQVFSGGDEAGKTTKKKDMGEAGFHCLFDFLPTTPSKRFSCCSLHVKPKEEQKQGGKNRGKKICIPNLGSGENKKDELFSIICPKSLLHDVSLSTRAPGVAMRFPFFLGPAGSIAHQSL